MGISTLLLGFGMALLVALLGWGNQIKEPQKETKRLEMLFARRLGTRYKTVNSAVSKLDTAFIQEGFASVIKSVREIIQKDKKQTTANLKQLNKLAPIEKKLDELMKKYDSKYEITLKLTMLCFGFGFITLAFEVFIHNAFIVKILSAFLIMVVAVWVTRIILILIDIHKSEKTFQRLISITDKDLED